MPKHTFAIQCDNISFRIDEFHESLLLFQSITCCAFVFFELLLSFVLLHFLSVFSFLCDDVLKDGLLVEKISIFAEMEKESQ